MVLESNEAREVYIELLKNIAVYFEPTEQQIEDINSAFNIKSGEKSNYVICRKDSKEHKQQLKKIKSNDNSYTSSAIFSHGKYSFFVNYSSKVIENHTKKMISTLIDLNITDKGDFRFDINSSEEEKCLIKNILGEYSERYNVIIFGAPGTGKSYDIKAALKGYGVKEGEVFRTTFYEDYSYYDFIGQYKPVVYYSQEKGDQKDFSRDLKGESEKETFGMPNISYEFISGVFIDAYVKACENKGREIFLIIEEINRGNSAAIFGEFFQSLDRKESGISEYSINISKELVIFLTEKTGIEHNGSFLLPSNLKIISTMNTSDQSLFKMDTAFKRRWYMKYSPITTKDVKDIYIKNSNINWAEFITVVNDLILKTLNNEDKMIGQYFCHIDQISKTISESEFKDKVLHYLFFDVFRFNREEIFNTESFSTVSQMTSEEIFELIKSK